MKNFIKTIALTLLAISFVGITSCGNSGSNNKGVDPFSNGGNERNLIVVISDIHLGADLDYAECNKNLPALENFLNQIKNSPNVKELVIAGDLLDEWFVPAPIDTYQGKDQADFVKRIAAANIEVFNVLNSIIQEKEILLTYVPGNHDLMISEESVNLVLPGINQVRDPELGLGTYYPAGYPEIAIEHGHRYNFFCSPDPFSNQDIAPGTIAPPGYFFTRIAALHITQGSPSAGDTVPVVTQNASGNDSQNLLFEYWKLWDWSLKYLTIENKFDEKLIETNINGFKGTYSVNDLLPYQATPGGVISVNLYKGIQDTWDQRQSHNRVSVNIPAARAIANSALEEEASEQAKIQYFLNPGSAARIVIFGHTHVPKIESSVDHLGQKAIYANSGTWIDHNTLSSSKMNFVVITPQNKDKSSPTYVKLFSIEKDKFVEMASDSIEL